MELPRTMFGIEIQIPQSNSMKKLIIYIEYDEQGNDQWNEVDVQQALNLLHSRATIINVTEIQNPDDMIVEEFDSVSECTTKRVS